MRKSMRQSTLETLGLGNTLDVFRQGKMPVSTGQLVDQVFGATGNRGALVISGVNGIVGAGKAMQLGSRLEPYGIPIVGLDFPGTTDGIARQFPGLVQTFGNAYAQRIMANISRLNYDGIHLPEKLKEFNPKFLLEAIPEILEVKKAHYKLFRDSFPGIEIRSVTSGFPSSELGVGIAHPAFPHEINKLWEIVEPQPSDITKLLWALGLMPVPVSDRWSFVLDVLFCGITLAGLRYHQASNMPYWKIDKFVRKAVGPNPFRAHDVIGARGASFLTWSCLHHLSIHYGDLFTPTQDLSERKDSGLNWYPPDHFRPIVNWKLDEEGSEAFADWILGPLFQMTGLMLKEERGHLSHINAIGEICAQFRKGILAVIRREGADKAIRRIESYRKLFPAASGTKWFPEVFRKIEDPEWQQLYVNAEHDGKTGLITIGRESYNQDVDDELNRAIDWLRAEGIRNVIVSGDFHLATQMVGADTSDFFAAMDDVAEGERIAGSWSTTARRLYLDFKVSVGFVNGKRCLGGFMELMAHCHYLVATHSVWLGMPEATLPIVPGMEGCHWMFRKAKREDWPRIMHLLLSGAPVRGKEAVGWLCDYSGTEEDALKMAWAIASGEQHIIPYRPVEEQALKPLPEMIDLPLPDNTDIEAGRKAIMDTIQAACGVTLPEALSLQSRHSAEFIASKYCKSGVIGAAYNQVMNV